MQHGKFGCLVQRSLKSTGAGKDLSTLASTLSSTGDVNLKAAGKITYGAALNKDTSEVRSEESSSWFGISLGLLGGLFGDKSSTDTSVQTRAAVTQLQSEADILSESGGDTRLQGTHVKANTFTANAGVGVGVGADPNAKVIIEGVTETLQTSHTEKTSSALWQSQSGNGKTEQALVLAQIEGKFKYSAPGGIDVQLPAGDPFKEQVKTLSQQPGMGYLQALVSSPNVNWSQVKLAHDSWSYDQQGLTGAGAALLAIAVAAASAGTASGLAAQIGATGATATAAAAGMSALASSAAVSLVNNGGDIGKTLKELGSSQNLKGIALAMVSAGVLSELGNSYQIDGKSLNKITAADGFTANLNKAVINNLANATMTSALTGASLEDSFKTGLVSALISAGSGQTANEIGNQTANDQALKALAHALAGCMAGAAGTGNSQGCQSGAVGAVVGELAAQWYDPTGTKKPQDTLNFVKVISAAAGALTGDGSAASVNTAVMAGVNAAMNNRLMHFDEKERIRIAAAGDAAKQERLTKAACFEIKCWAQYPEGSELYKANYVSVAEMGGLQAEWDWVKGQKSFGAFNYTVTQKLTDILASTTGMASGTLGGKPITPSTSNAQNCATVECVAGLRPAVSDMRTVAQIDKDLKTKICSWSVGGAINTIIPGSVVMKPVVDIAGKVVGWFAEKAFDQMTSDGASGLVCQY